MRQMARTQQRMWMRKQLKAQGGLCPLCKKEIDISKDREGVIDHDHTTGECRGVLHRSCNAAEGKVRHAVVCWGTKTSDYEEVAKFLQNLADYLKQPGLGVIYAQHQTPEQKKKAAAARRRRKLGLTAAKKVLRKFSGGTQHDSSGTVAGADQDSAEG